MKDTVWNNPIGLERANHVISGGAGAVQHYGDEIWDMITFHYEGFHVRTIMEGLLKDHKLAEKTAYCYVLAFINYALAVPEQFTGEASRMYKVRNGWYKLIDAP